MLYHERIKYCKNSVAKKLLQLICDKQTNLALSADVNTSKELLSLADNMGSEICVLKTHVDIITDFTPALITKLKDLSEKHQFLIFEDRKFADIGNTVKQQYAQGIYRIADWADIINAHSLPGDGIVTGLKEMGLPKNRGLLLLAEMSSANNLLDESYAHKTLAMAERFSDFVFGFIAQRKICSAPHWIYFTPGVQFEQKNDAHGQQYITPETAIIKNQTDIIIVGRGILQAKDPIDEAKKYRCAGWEAAYLSK